MFLVLIIYTATSTDVECAFSCGRLTVSRMWHSLSDETTHAATVLSLWTALPGLVLEVDILKVFQEKNSCIG